MKFDLHSHSHYSDGALSPGQLVILAKESGISHLALTDHDTLNGLEKAQIAAEQHAIKLINGVELSCSWNAQLLHIVGLGVDKNDAPLLQGVQQNTERRFIRAQAMLEDFLAHDIDLEQEVNSLLYNAAPTRPHFAQALVNLGYAKNKQQAFKRYLVPGKPGYVAMQWPDLTDIGGWINGAGGIAVLAHPMRYKFTRTKLVRLIEDMKAAGVSGIEVSTATTDPAQADMLAELSRQHQLLASMGSDFHSHDQPWARLGGAAPLPDNTTPVWTKL